MVSKIFALITAIFAIFPNANQYILGVSTLYSSIYVFQIKNLRAEENKNISSIAKQITVRIEGAIQGSGVIVNKKKNIYTVLTAWHVIKDFLPDEEVEIITSDNKTHIWIPKSKKRLRNEVDLALLKFKSNQDYKIAKIGNKKIIQNDKIFVSGYPIRKEALEIPIFLFKEGKVEGNSSLYNDEGYQLLYSNLTLEGMSGGSILDNDGYLIGIHGRAVLHKKLTEKFGKPVATGINSGIPISYYREFLSGKSRIIRNGNPINKEDLLVKMSTLLQKNNKDNETIKSAKKFLELEENAIAYSYIALAKYFQNNLEESLDNLSKAIDLEPENYNYFYNRSLIKSDLNDIQGAIRDYEKASELSKDNNGFSHLPPIIKSLKQTSQNLALDKEELETIKDTILITVFDKLTGGEDLPEIGLKNIEKKTDEMNESFPEVIKKFNEFIESGKIQEDLEKLSTMFPSSLNTASEKSINKNPNNLPYLINKANKYFSLKDYKNALKYSTKAISLNIKGGKNGNLYYLRGISNLELGKLKDACKDFMKAIKEKNKETIEYMSNKGSWCRKLSKNNN